MYKELIREKLFEQEEIYQRIKAGDLSSVQYLAYRDEEWGTRDANYLNRMRIAYYLLYAGIDDEDTIVRLFQEELKDRKTNSFQGIGNTLNVLTAILQRYNSNGRYDALYDEAKSANFDCACGYDKRFQIDNEIDSLDLLESIYLAQDLEYKDVMEVIVGVWKNSIKEWTESNRTTLIRFNSFLGKEQDNEAIYKELLENAMMSGKTFNIVSVYNKVIRYYIDSKQFVAAESYLHEMIETVDFGEIERIRLFSDVLEECCDLICNAVESSSDLWVWTKPYLQKRSNMYGNLYTKGIAAAKATNDSYATQLEQEYVAWKTKMKL